MELTKFLAFLAVVLPVAYGAPTQASANLHPKILEAMKRDLGLDAEQATARVAREIAATDLIEKLKTSAADSFAGAWVSADGSSINVAITDASLAAQVTDAGATPITVSNSLTKLQDAQKALDSIDIAQAQTFSTDATPVGIAAYYVDVASNKLVIEALPGSTSHAEGLAAEVGLVASEFEVVTVDAMPTTLATVQGGDAYYINRSARCSIGFSVTTGFVSAGHCGDAGDSATTSAAPT
ncbi:hypothetical protein G7054_g9847 [Neopestalotiopsis clavispora]|nr:hypothetical protein G7054_g9847 [Neopestalotiopsis clavispora]